jgi:hypothetical protein
VPVRLSRQTQERDRSCIPEKRAPMLHVQTMMLLLMTVISTAVAASCQHGKPAAFNALAYVSAMRISGKGVRAKKSETVRSGSKASSSCTSFFA